MNPNVLLALILIGVAALLIVTAIPLVLGKVKMNTFYGIRIKKAFLSDDNWYKINEYGGRKLIVWSVVLALFGVVTFFLPLGTEEHPNEIMVVAVSFAPLLILIPWLIQVLLFVRKV